MRGAVVTVVVREPCDGTTLETLFKSCCASALGEGGGGGGGGRSDSLRTDKLQGRKRGREQEREEEGEVGICLSQGGVSLFLLCSDLPAAGVFFFPSASLTISLPAACWRTLAVFWLPDLIFAWTEQPYTARHEKSHSRIRVSC